MDSKAVRIELTDRFVKSATTGAASRQYSSASFDRGVNANDQVGTLTLQRVLRKESTSIVDRMTSGYVNR
jgi:hypothetical protein